MYTHAFIGNNRYKYLNIEQDTTGITRSSHQVTPFFHKDFKEAFMNMNI